MCNIPISEEEVQLVTFSHFDTAYFGLTNFAPFFTALAAVIALVFLCVYCFTQWHWFFNAAKHFLFAGIVFSLLPLLFGAQFVTTVGILLSVIMTAQLALMHFLIKDPAAK